MLDRTKQVYQRSTQVVDCPGHDNIDLALAGVFQHLVEAGALITSLAAADPFIPVDLYDRPTTMLGDLLQFPKLVIRGLIGCRDPQIDGCPLVVRCHVCPFFHGTKYAGRQWRGNAENNRFPAEIISYAVW